MIDFMIKFVDVFRYKMNENIIKTKVYFLQSNYLNTSRRNMLINTVIKQYLNIRLFHIGRTETQLLHVNKIRNVNNKLVLFAGQLSVTLSTN